MKSRINSIRITLRQALAISGIVCLIIGLSLGQSLWTKALTSWQITPRPQLYTELYFTDHQHLARSAKAGSVQTVPFTIYNREQRTVVYDYKLVATLAETRTHHIVSQGKVQLTDNHSQEMQPTFLVPPDGKRLMVAVVLQYEGMSFGHSVFSAQAESIHYWLDVTGLVKAGGHI